MEGTSGAMEKKARRVRRKKGGLWGCSGGSEGQREDRGGPRDLADLKDDCDFSGCANGGSHTGEWCSLTHSLER